MCPGELLAVAAADPAEAIALADRLGRFAPGEVTWGGAPRADMPLAQVRERIVVDEHDSYLFAGTQREVLRIHREIKTRASRYLIDANPLMILSAPVIYSLIVPIALVDLWVMAYQAICFPVYKIPKVRRRDYLVFDRHHLAYLNIIEKVNCAYCSYANGAIAFVREVAARTEVYWCPIKHARRVLGPHPHYQGFADFGDAGAFRGKLAAMKAGVKIERA